MLVFSVFLLLLTTSYGFSMTTSPVLCDLANLPFDDAFLTSISKGASSPKIIEGTERIQSGSHSAVIDLVSEQIYVKKVVVNPKRNWADKRRQLCYARNEAVFYSKIARHSQAKFNSPKLFHVSENLEAIGSQDISADPGEEPDLTNVGAIFFLQPFSADSGYFSKSPLNIAESTNALQGLAKLHASFWENETVLTEASSTLSRYGGSHALQNRNLLEMGKIETNFLKFCDEFASTDEAFFARADIRAAGARLQSAAKWVSSQTTADPTSKNAVIVHGDYKAANVFISDDASKPPVLFDFASAGIGFGTNDVAMHIAHAIRPDDLENGGELQLVNAYCDALIENGATNIDRDLIVKKYELGVLDYVRFVWGRFYGSVSVEAWEKKKNDDNVALPNRNVDSAKRWAAKVVEILDKYENEIKFE